MGEHRQSSGDRISSQDFCGGIAAPANLKPLGIAFTLFGIADTLIGIAVTPQLPVPSLPIPQGSARAELRLFVAL